LVVILTVVQPFICLHPVIIWSQDSNHNSAFLLLIIAVWFLPVGAHLLAKALVGHCRPKIPATGQDKLTLDPDGDMSKVDLDASTRSVNARHFARYAAAERAAESSARRRRSIVAFDFALQIFMLAIFLASFSLITHKILHMEFNRERQNLQDFLLPAISSVFFWMVSISYLLLAVVMGGQESSSKALIFEDQNLEEARKLLRTSLRRRLATMDSRSERARTIQRHRELGVIGPPPPVPPRPQGRQRRKVSHSTLPAMPPDHRVPVREESSVVIVAEKNVRDRVKQFEEIKMRPMMTRQRSKNAEKYVIAKEDDKIESVEEPPAKVEHDHGQGHADDEERRERRGKCRRFFDFILERREYRDPVTYGWRIRFRRLFLSLGTLLFTCLTANTAAETQSFSSKKEIQRLLDYTGTNLTWPDGGSALDDVFGLYNGMQRVKSYIMVASTCLFWAGLTFDMFGYRATTARRRALCLAGSRVTNLIGSLFVFAAVVVVGLPDYLEASNLEEICPYCGREFNETFKQAAEFAIGLFFACLFTFQLMPILVTVAPALVRASALILVHPSLQIEEREGTTLRMNILQQVIQFSSLLAFPITFISMAIVQQYQKDVVVTLLILAFWTVPPVVLTVGLHYTRKYRRYAILLWVYYLYNFCYFFLLLCLVVYSATLERIVELIRDLMKDPFFFIGSVSQVFLGNVVISDMLYASVF